MAQVTSVALSSVQWEALHRLAADLAARFPQDVLEVRLFGSRARGDAGPGSDVDLLVVVRSEAPEDIRDAVRQARDATWSDDFPLLAPFVIPESEFRRHQATRDLLYRELRDQGIPLWRNGVDLWNEEGIPVADRERDIHFEIDQAAEALKLAEIALNEGMAGRAAAQAYYAAFHAASAVLLPENIERAKHGDLIGEFNRLTHQNRLLGREFHKKLGGLYELRQVADYGKVYVKDKDARQAVETAERFVDAAREYSQRWLDRQEPER